MSGEYYEIVYSKYQILNNNYSIINYERLQLLKLLLDIIYHKTDAEFDLYYYDYISSFKFEKYYDRKNTLEGYCKNIFANPKDFIVKTTYHYFNELYYKNLTAFIKTQNPKEEIKEEIKEPKKKKMPISAALKRKVWNTHIGEEIGKFKCLCCNDTDITQLSFHCGHIIAEANGGETTVSNLKPICPHCNSSMGRKNMNDFIELLK